MFGSNYSREDFVPLPGITGTYFLYVSKDAGPLIISEIDFEDYLLGEKVPIITPRVFFYLNIENMQNSVNYIQPEDIPSGIRSEDIPKALENLERKEQERKKYYTSLDEMKSFLNGENVSEDLQERAEDVLSTFFGGDRTLGSLKKLSPFRFVLDWRHGLIVHIYCLFSDKERKRQRDAIQPYILLEESKRYSEQQHRIKRKHIANKDILDID